VGGLRRGVEIRNAIVAEFRSALFRRFQAFPPGPPSEQGIALGGVLRPSGSVAT